MSEFYGIEYRIDGEDMQSIWFGSRDQRDLCVNDAIGKWLSSAKVQLNRGFYSPEKIIYIRPVQHQQSWRDLGLEYILLEAEIIYDGGYMWDEHEKACRFASSVDSETDLITKLDTIKDKYGLWDIQTSPPKEWQKDTKAFGYFKVSR